MISANQEEDKESEKPLKIQLDFIEALDGLLQVKPIENDDLRKSPKPPPKKKKTPTKASKPAK